jgi:hypothetical protein
MDTYGLNMNNPEISQVWRHTNGIEYEVTLLANFEISNIDYPKTVIYTHTENGNIYSRFLSDWHRSFARVYPDRFIVDERTGCIAVRDTGMMDDNQGLHPDMEDVVAYWTGERSPIGDWTISPWQRDKACDLQVLLNKLPKDA